MTGNCNSGTGSIIPCTPTINGGTLLLLVSCDTKLFVTAKDGAGNSFQSAIQQNSGSAITTAILYEQNAPSTTGVTILGNDVGHGSAGYFSALLIELPPATLDVVSSGTTTGNSYSSGGVAVTGTNDFLVGMHLNLESSVLNPDVPWIEGRDGSNVFLNAGGYDSFQYQNVGSIGTFAASGTVAAGTATVVSVMAAFK